MPLVRRRQRRRSWCWQLCPQPVFTEVGYIPLARSLPFLPPSKPGRPRSVGTTLGVPGLSPLRVEYSMWHVYVIQSLAPRTSSRGKPLPGFFYVGSTTDPARRLKQHNGETRGGGRYTAKHRPWIQAALYGPYNDRSEAFKAEMALKHGKRGVARTCWTPEDHPLCRGLGSQDPWVTSIDPAGLPGRTCAAPPGSSASP